MNSSFSNMRKTVNSQLTLAKIQWERKKKFTAKSTVLREAVSHSFL